MFRLSLKIKFGFLLSGFVVATGLIILLSFATSKNVASHLDQVKSASFPQFSEATELVASFEKITHKVEDAVVLGERSLLDKGEEEKVLFYEHIKHMSELTKGVSASVKLEVSSIRDHFDEYYLAASEFAQLLLESAEKGEELGELSGEARPAVRAFPLQFSASGARGAGDGRQGVRWRAPTRSSANPTSGRSTGSSSSSTR